MFRKLLVFVSVLMLVGASNSMAGKGPGSGGDPSTLSEDELHYLEYMRLEEKLARDAYITLYDLWGNTVFINISESEQQHTDSIEKLLDKYGLPDPVLDESIDGVGDFFGYVEFEALFDYLMDLGDESELDALMVGAVIEEKDMVDIKKAIDATDNADIVNTYENLLCGSRNHLRAFVANIELQGEEYIPPLYFTYLPDDEKAALAAELEDIAYSQTERCGN